MYRENYLTKIEESRIGIWKNWWMSKEPRLPNERKTFEFIFSENNSFQTLGDSFRSDQNKTIFDLYDRKITLNTYCLFFWEEEYLELSFFDFSRKYRKKDFVSLKFKEENFIFEIVGVRAKRLTLFDPPIITKLICKNFFL